jgi:lipopolysaccharide transport system ATP-binding protein
MSSEVVIKVQNVGKSYHLYSNPSLRLKQFVVPKVASLFGKSAGPYYREFWALRDINFEVQRGDSVGILGRNGSGKSTLLQIITGTLFPSTGTVETKGRLAALLELGSGFNPDFTGRENVYLNGAILGLTREEIDERFDSIAGFADIGSHLDQPVKTYSSGMLVRLAFAVQVQIEPDILIVDEALAVGDALFQKRCYQRLHKLLDRGTTVLFVSHDQESVRTLTKTAILLRDGVISAEGKSNDVVLEYRRQLSEDERNYFSSYVQQLNAGVESSAPIEPPRAEAPASEAHPPAADSPHSERSFGRGGVCITKVEVLDQAGSPCALFFPGDRVQLRVHCKSEIDCGKLNVSLRIRNKEGVKIYSWGSLNQDMKTLTSDSNGDIFWRKSVKQGEAFSVEFSFDCLLGSNLYEVQACVSHEETPDYGSQTVLHWMDEAAFFQVAVRRDVNFFGGVVDLKMVASW